MLKNNINILCTRPLNDAIIQKAAVSNINIEIASFIETTPILSPNIINEIKTLSTQKIIAIFTSMNAVEAVTNQINLATDWRFYCLSGTTKDLIIDFWGNESIIATAKNSSELCEKIIQNRNEYPIYFFAGDQRLDSLPAILNKHSVHFTELLVYSTIHTPKQLDSNFDGIVFFSPSAVHSFFSNNVIDAEVVLFSIGDTTKATIESYVPNKIIMSDFPSKEMMIEKATAYFNNN